MQRNWDECARSGTTVLVARGFRYRSSDSDLGQMPTTSRRHEWTVKRHQRGAQHVTMPAPLLRRQARRRRRVPNSASRRAATIASISRTRLDEPISALMAFPKRRAEARKCGSLISLFTAAAISVSDAVGGNLRPAPFTSTRAALSPWSRPLGKISWGRPLIRARQTVPWPP